MQNKSGLAIENSKGEKMTAEIEFERKYSY